MVGGIESCQESKEHKDGSTTIILTLPQVIQNLKLPQR